jgi:hypothetical protein
VKKALDSERGLWIAAAADGESLRSTTRRGVQGQMKTGLMGKFLEARGVAAIVGCLLATAVIWAMAGVALAAGPSISAPPVISGTLQAGQTLSVSTGTWTSTDPGGITSFAYAWTSGGAPVGSDSASYPVGTADIGKDIAVTVSATDATGTAAAPPVSAGVVPAPPANTGPPTISGVAQQGLTLTASTGTWSGPTPMTFSYAWTSGGLAVGTNSATYAPTLADVGKLIAVTVSATNAGGGPVTALPATAGPVLPLAPANSAPPTIAGTAQQGQMLTVTQGTWLNSPTSITDQWEDCAGLVCTPILGKTGTSYTVGAGDVGDTIRVVETAFNAATPPPPALPGVGVAAVSALTATVSATSSTSVVAFSQNAPTTNQAITLVATVLSGSGNANPHGSLSFFDGSDVVPGCANKAVNGGQTITIVCQAAFPAGVAQISAAYLADPGALVTGSSSDTTQVSIGKGPTSVSVAVTPRVAPGGRATYVATLEVPTSDAGPTLPGGSIEFLDGGQPIGACANQALNNLTATCSVSYPSPGTHNISALYNGDADFIGSTSSASSVQIVQGAPSAPRVQGALGSTLGWKISFHPHYSELIGLEAFALAKGTAILVQCNGKGCPFAKWRSTKDARTINLLPRFRHHRLRAGTRITVRLMRRHWVGKYYSFTIRAGRAPLVRTNCLAPGNLKPGVGCTNPST